MGRTTTCRTGRPARLGHSTCGRRREETLARQKQLGVVPPDTQLTARPNELPAWDSLSADQKRLYARMAEVSAGALAHADHNIGRVIDAIRDLGELDNTLIIYIMGDNGCSGEGTVQGTTNELAVNANGVVEDMPYLLSMIDELGSDQTYNHMPAAGPCLRHAVPVDEAGRLALRRHAQWPGALVAEAHQRCRRYPHAVPPRDRHRSDHL